jgi:phage shock protein PspC (stress-responsive transcriptional regulator)
MTNGEYDSKELKKRGERLVEEMKQEARERDRREVEHDEKYRIELKKKRITGTIAGGVVALIFGISIGEIRIGFIVTLVIFETAAAFAIVYKQLEYYWAIPLYAAPGILLPIIFLLLGWLGVNAAAMLCTFLFYAVVGFLLSTWVHIKEVDARVD